MQMSFPLAEQPDEIMTEKGRKLFAGESTFVKGVVAMSGLPDADRMEVCFAGRSNVGKSSLINSLTGHKALVEKWQRLLKQYLSGRQTLRRAFVLIDSRHGIKKVDAEIMKLLDSSAVTFQVVMTKADKVKEKDRAAVLSQVREALSKHPAAYPEIVLTSSEKGDGIPTLRAIIAGLE